MSTGETNKWPPRVWVEFAMQDTQLFGCTPELRVSDCGTTGGDATHISLVEHEAIVAEHVKNARMEIGRRVLAESKLERYRKALEWYAKAGPMDMASDCDFKEEKIGTIFAPGKRARAALVEASGAEGGK